MADSSQPFNPLKGHHLAWFIPTILFILALLVRVVYVKLSKKQNPFSRAFFSLSKRTEVDPDTVTIQK